jgi:hypothetical protein
MVPAYLVPAFFALLGGDRVTITAGADTHGQVNMVLDTRRGRASNGSGIQCRLPALLCRRRSHEHQFDHRHHDEDRSCVSPF